MRRRDCLLLAGLLSQRSRGQVILPAYTRQTLPNGAVLLLLRKADVPLLSLRAVFRGGAEAEPPGLHGLAFITTELLQRGTPSRSAEQIALELDSLGATLQLRSGRQSSSAATEFLTQRAALALPVFEDVLRNPVFPEEEVKKVLARATDQVRASKDNPASSIGRYFDAFFYPPGHPYRTSGAADEASLARMNRDAIRSFYQRLYVGRNLILVAAGDFDPQKMGTNLAKLAGALPAGAVFAPPRVTLPRFTHSRLLLIDKPDATQTYFRIGMPGIDRTSPDRVPLMLVNTIFGGRFTSMLNDELRVNTGLTYGADSIVNMDRLTGAIIISSYTETSSTEKAIDLALEILRRLTQKGLNAEQLASAKAYIKGNYPTDRLETAEQLASVLGELELFGLGKGEIDDLFPQIDSVTLEQANAVARRYFTTANLQFCLVGAADKIRDAVKKYAARMQVIASKDPGFTAPPF